MTRGGKKLKCIFFSSLRIFLLLFPLPSWAENAVSILKRRRKGLLWRTLSPPTADYARQIQITIQNINFQFISIFKTFNFDNLQTCPAWFFQGGCCVYVLGIFSAFVSERLWVGGWVGGVLQWNWIVHLRTSIPECIAMHCQCISLVQLLYAPEYHFAYAVFWGGTPDLHLHLCSHRSQIS